MSNFLSARLATMASFGRKQEGASAVEYALILGILGVAVIAAFILLGGSLEGVFETVSTQLESGG